MARDEYVLLAGPDDGDDDSCDHPDCGEDSDADSPDTDDGPYQRGE